jgi:hypothetical protein
VATEDLCEEEPVIVIMRLKLFSDHEDANNDDEGGSAGVRVLCSCKQSKTFHLDHVAQIHPNACTVANSGCCGCS